MGLGALGGLHARIRCRLAELAVLAGGSMRGALAQLLDAAPFLESEADSDGAAEAWAAAGEMCYLLGDSPADEDALNRALDHAIRGQNSYLQLSTRMWLAITLRTLRVSVDVAIGRVEQLTADASAEPWA